MTDPQRLAAETIATANAKTVCGVARALGLRLIRSRSLIGGNVAQYRGDSIAFDAALSITARDEALGHEIGHHISAIRRLRLGDKEEAFADAFGAALLRVLGETYPQRQRHPAEPKHDNAAGVDVDVNRPTAEGGANGVHAGKSTAGGRRLRET